MKPLPDNTQRSMPTAGSEPAIPASVRPQTYVLVRAATGIGVLLSCQYLFTCYNTEQFPAGLVASYVCPHGILFLLRTVNRKELQGSQMSMNIKH